MVKVVQNIISKISNTFLLDVHDSLLMLLSILEKYNTDKFEIDENFTVEAGTINTSLA